MPEMIIVAANLGRKAIEFFECPSKMYSVSTVAKELSTRAECSITESDVLEFRKKHFRKHTTLPVPLVDTKYQLTPPATLEEMCSERMIDTLGIRNGVIGNAFLIMSSAQKDNDPKIALSSMDLMLKGADSLDKKLKALSPNSDPAALILKSREFQKFKSIIIAIDQRYPDFEL